MQQGYGPPASSSRTIHIKENHSHQREPLRGLTSLHDYNHCHEPHHVPSISAHVEVYRNTMGPYESIHPFLGRFNNEAMKVHTLAPDVAIHLLVTSLMLNLFKMELSKDTFHNMEDVQSIAQ
ncbi:hypothetical protein Lal_00037622 [Lupinus albus]|nr:hypothetical protein Lal_00037622 [Lupinus albus]